MTRPLIIAQDLSAVGTISMAAALPVYALASVPVAVLPTKLLSTQTEGFDTPATTDLNHFLDASFAHWAAADLAFSGIIVGYLGAASLIDQLRRVISEQDWPLVVVDPAMADEGGFYPGLNQAYLERLLPLLQLATVLTPNWTEAKLLVQDSAMVSDDRGIKRLFEALTKRFPKAETIVLTGIERQTAIVTAVWHLGTIDLIETPRISGHFYGAGDVFTALLSAGLWHGLPALKATQKAVRHTEAVISATQAAGLEPRFGMQIGHSLDNLTFDN